MIVVGSGNSSNSVRLVEVALEAGARTSYRVDDASEIDEAWLEGVDKVSVTSGASVPEELVQGVLAFLAERGYPDAQAVHSAEESLIFALPKELRRDLKAAGPGRPGLSRSPWRATSTSTRTTRSRGCSAQVADALRDDALIAYPTDSGYALGCRIGNRDGRDRILRIRGLDDKHHFTLVCKDFAQLGQLVHVDNSAFRAIKAATPGPVHVHPPGDARGAAAAAAPEEAHRRRPDPRPHVGAGAARGVRRAAAHQHPDPARRGRGPDLGLGDQGGARPRRSTS